MNRVAKGRRNESRCAKELESRGYQVWKTIRHRFLNIDLWGKFDVAALAKDGSHILLIQVKTNEVDKSVRDDIADLNVPPYILKQVWVWKDREGWEVHDLTNWKHSCYACQRPIRDTSKCGTVETEDGKTHYLCVPCVEWANSCVRAVSDATEQVIKFFSDPQPEDEKKETIN